MTQQGYTWNWPTDTGRTIHHVPTSDLRWRRGTLQQKWQVVTCYNGRAESTTTDWRDVPTDDE